jgi:putative GTP pyrophosphokinase
MHARPLTRVAAGLRYFVAEVSEGPVIVGQRLKRMETIRDKLERQPKMALSRMHDIGGCRAVLPDQTAVDHVIERLRAQRGWDLLDRTWDYVAQPKADGYRAKHLVARKDEVLIEIQLRTEVQHMWAELVERIDRRYSTGLKTGRAERQLRDLLAAGSRIFAEAEAEGRSLDTSATMSSLRSLFDAADDVS